MKKILSLPLLLAAVSPALAQYELTFDSAGQYTANFSTAQAPVIVQSATGGLNGSGSLDLAGMTGGETAQQIITFNHSFAGNLPSWSASVFYYGDAQRFWQFGFTTSPAPGLVDSWAFDGYGEHGYAPSIWLESGNLDGGAFAIGSYDGLTSPVYDVVVVEGGLTTSAAWYKYTLSVAYTGASNYTLSGTLTQAHADGTLGPVLGTVNLSVENAALASDSSVHLYLNLYDGVALDNFATTTHGSSAIPEPSTYALILGGLVMCGVALRNRRLNSQR